MTPLVRHVRRGTGRPLLLIHGLGGSWRSWDPVADALATQRELVMIDLPGFGATAPLDGEVSIAALADAVEGFLADNDLRGIDVAGSSMGARLALELARRGAVGAAVALDPSGFWNRAERRAFATTIGGSVRVLRSLRSVLRGLVRSRLTRTALLAQLSARPWQLDRDVVLRELRGCADSPGFDPTLQALVDGPPQEGLPAGSAEHPIVLVWGRRDRVTFPRQAARAQSRFPDAELVWLDGCGHFPQWDAPAEAARVILDATDRA